MAKKKYFYRWTEERDSKGRLVKVNEVHAETDPAISGQLEREVNSHKEEIEREQKEAEYIKHYSLRKLIVVLNYALPRGMITTESRTEFLNKVDEIIKTDDVKARAEEIDKLLAEPGNEAVKGLFEVMGE